ncbi:MAG: cation diffusion facilitator family transporter [Planctomycetota bacterium]
MRVKRARTVAGRAILVVLALGVFKGMVGYMAGSVALQADAVHTSVDLLAIFASWFGLTLATRPASSRFPYGYYRAETLAALVVSIIIVGMGILFLKEGITRLTHPPELSHPYLTMGMGTFSAIAALLISTWEKRAADAAGSQSLAATAAEARMDALSSCLVLISGVAAAAGIAWLDGVMAACIACFIMGVGVVNIKHAALSLMDASVNPQLEQDIKDFLARVEGVHNVEKVLLRRAGPFYFLDGHIRVDPALKVEEGHKIGHRAQRLVRDKFSTIEGIMFHIEPDPSCEEKS